MDVYRITRVDPKGSYRKLPGKPEVRYGTKRRASAVARQVREDNAARRRLNERLPRIPYRPAELLIERAPAGEFTDVTAEFLGDDGEGGVSVPRGDSPDPKAPGEARIPCATG